MVLSFVFFIHVFVSNPPRGRLSSVRFKTPATPLTRPRSWCPWREPGGERRIPNPEIAVQFSRSQPPPNRDDHAREAREASAISARRPPARRIERHPSPKKPKNGPEDADTSTGPIIAGSRSNQSSRPGRRKRRARDAIDPH